ncbi:hypothetical protein RI844_11580 [Thalassotalea fonticola]|uniref:Uncharacterized protein n=1 Tax=Thalassotalea fonticola TaxID=3065649 RepID=A0ABZ0GJH9_9GAMM|nr:hypothetical protein RI844_11580 [Colwelliaceae bacterium S1-1]
MSILFKNKVASAVAATLLLSSAPLFAENLIPEGDLESWTGNNIAFDTGPTLANGTTQAWGRIGSGWCRFIDDTITSEKVGVTEHAPEGNTSNVAYCNHLRTDDSGGIYRSLENIELDKTYSVSGKGATRGALQWAIEYTKQGEDVVTVVDMDNVVVSDLAWVTIEDMFTVPVDADLTKEFRVFLHTQRSAAFPDAAINNTERSLMWVDDYEVVAQIESVEYFTDSDLESVTGFSSGNSTLGNGNGPLLSDGVTDAYIAEAAGFKSGWTRFINTDRTQSGPAGSEAIPAGNDSNVVFFANHNRNNDAAGLGRIVEGIQAGETYQLSGDAATKGSIRWGYSYVKTGEETRTPVALTNIVESDGAWVNVSDSFVAPADIDATKNFVVYIFTAPSTAYPLPLTDDVLSLERSLLWTDNYSLMGPPSLADSDGDGVPDSADPFPNDAAASVDTDLDGKPDEYNAECDETCQQASDLVIDDDDDGDSVLDVNDGYPLDNTQSIVIGFANQSGMTVEGEEFTIDASPSIPNNEAATYTWSQDSGLPVDLTPNGSSVTFTAPVGITQIEEIVISLTVEDTISTVSDTFAVTVTKAPSIATPAATVTGMLDSDGMVLAYGEKIQLDGSASTDSDDGILTYQWKVNGVPITFSDATAVNPTFYVPLVKADTPITIELTVTNYQRDYDGSYLLNENGDKIVSTSATVAVPATIKKTYPVVEYPLEYFPDGDLESVTGFATEGWAIGNKSFNDENSIFLSSVDEKGNPVPAYGRIGSGGFARFINETRTQLELGYDVRAPEGRTGVVALFNHSREDHNSGIYREVEGIVPGATYTLTGDGATIGTLQWAYAYTKVDEDTVTIVDLNTTAESALTWVTLTEDFVAPADIDVTQPFRVYMHTVGDASEVLKNTDEARLWIDNYSLQELPSGLDTDLDGVIDLNDGFPENAAIAADTDGDGLPDDYVKTCDQTCIDSSSVTLDNDDDNDGVLDVNDGHPKDSQQTIKIAMAQDATNVFETEEVTIDASASIPNAENATYAWTQESGIPVTLMVSEAGGSVMFTAPDDLAQEEVIELKLTIENGIASVSEIHTVTVTNAPSVITPNLKLSGMADVEGMTLLAGETITIDASATTDSEAGQLSYVWQAKGGVPIDFQENFANPASKIFTVPEINSDTPLTIEVTISNYQRDYDGSYILDEEGNKIEWISETVEVQATVIKTKQEKPDSGSFGFLTMFLLSGLTVVRRFSRNNK